MDNSWCAPHFAQVFRLPMRLVTKLGSVTGSDFSRNLIGKKFDTSLTGCKMCTINHIEGMERDRCCLNPSLYKIYVLFEMPYILFEMQDVSQN